MKASSRFLWARWRLTVLAAVMMAPLPTLAEQTLACSSPPCVLKDVLIVNEGYTRIGLAADSRMPTRLAVSSSLSSCGSRVAVHGSDDGGATWTASCLPPGEFSDFDGAPDLAFDDQGTLFAASVDQAQEYGEYPQMHRSMDGGKTWSEPLDVGTAGYGRDGRAGHMRVKADISPASAFRGSVYAVLPVNTVEYTEAFVLFNASRDGGDTWSDRAASPYDTAVGKLAHADLAIDRKGRLYLSYVQCRQWGPQGCMGSEADLMLSTSQDGGVTWRSRGLFATVSNSVYSPVLAVDLSRGTFSGHLYSVRSTRANGRWQVQVSTSADGGKTWSAAVPVSGGGTASQLAPAAVVAHDGVLAVSWIDQLDDQPGSPTQPMMALSSDGGVSFSAPMPLTSKPRKLDYPYSMADANQLAATGHRVHAAYGASDRERELGVHYGGVKR